ncbi:MAG: VCBS repeat-containing protein [Planctomycetes bacterium]|nr:VCBS repeat-containing protein [Planctomycetota bacterium]
MRTFVRGSLFLLVPLTSFAVVHAQHVPWFGAPAFDCGAGPDAIVVDDFDGNGRADIAVAASLALVPGAPQYTVLKSDSFGGFQRTDFTPTTVASARRFAARDVTGDGRSELLACEWTPAALRVLTNDGSGGFASSTTYSVGNQPSDVALGDFDGDGDVDAAVSERGAHSVRVLQNDGSGGFGSSSTFSTGSGSAPRSIATLDANADGKLDLVVGRSSPVDLAVYAGNGAGSFSFLQSLTVGGVTPEQVRAADFNGDGRLDVFVRCFAGSSNSFGVFLALASGGFTTSVFFVGSAQLDVLLADLNEDGHVDVVEPWSTALIHFGTGTGGVGMFAPPVVLPAGIVGQAFGVGDFDGDAFVDLGVALPENAVVVLAGNGTGSFALPASASAGTVSTDSAVGDVDGDGDLDAVVADQASDGFVVVRGDGAGGLTTGAAHSTGPGSRPSAIALGDVDSDGDLDVATANFGIAIVDRDATVLLNTGNGSFGPAVHYPTGGSPQDVKFADLDGDGLLDLLVGTNEFGARWLKGDGSGGFGAAQFVALHRGAQVVVGDFDADGVADLADVGGSNGFGVALGLGGGAFAAPTTVTSSTLSFQTLAAADMDADGDDDLVLAGSTVVFASSNGTGSFGPPVSLGFPASGYAGVAVFDANADGKLDIVAGDSTLALRGLAGDGMGGFVPPLNVSCAHGSFDGSTGDFDGDARSDVLTRGVGLTLLVNHGDDQPTVVYCSGKTNSQGCTPSIASNGIPSATATSGFVITGKDVLNQKLGLLFYGLSGPSNAPFSGGVLCVHGPVLRTPQVNAGGSLPPTADCSGAFSLDFNAFIASGTGAPGLQVPGTVVHTQWWGRDPQHQSAFKTQLSDALAFVIQL